MSQLSDYFYIRVSDDKMTAEIYCKEVNENIDQQFDTSMIIRFLKENKIIFGIIKHAIESISTNVSSIKFPIIIAKGNSPENGKDGEIKFTQNRSSEVSRDDYWNFRDVMRLPNVNKGDKLAKISLPTQGKDGMNVEGKILKSRPGKPITLKPGAGVIFKEESLSFYANKEGLLNVTNRLLQVDDVYTVNETLSMKTGNLDFNGSIVIKGDVPTGYTVKAEGNINIYGIVEAANIISGGSIYISEGISGLQKGYIYADRDIHIGYINQGVVEAGHSIYVENSIIHSECIAKERILCQQGNIIGGSLSVGKSIEARDIGNRLSTKTSINLGLNKTINEERFKLESEIKKLATTLEQLEIIGKKLATTKNQIDPKMRITLLRQRRSYEQLSEKMNALTEKLKEMDAYMGSEDEAYLKIKNNLHPNVIISFGKYSRKINKQRQSVYLKLLNNDIMIESLNN